MVKKYGAIRFGAILPECQSLTAYLGRLFDRLFGRLFRVVILIRVIERPEEAWDDSKISLGKLAIGGKDSRWDGLDRHPVTT
jgi:hypothetical protein